MTPKPGKARTPAPDAASHPAESRTDISPKTAGRAQSPTKPASELRKEQLQKHNPAQGTPSIRRNPEAGKPKEQRTNRGAKLPHDAPSAPTSKNPSKRSS
jgi:hypothetical protein